ncbi:DUF3857 domain-containing transglutaminase family protein [Marinagarivorans cellulosilyticus]|uniref:DUF3857 domain-containing protein n=1 Tax=Marinagarivorans cellulosilyticus TaxID=2721545 RepID=A0AAN1WKL5_9GAMM|nr:DUF3857 and transglutaminase domain-containing protein [Marinagarivorans cellulosilyticus]BCD99381.1 hypothetical protein MARGE09_P3583 [Marinagarivorans cellulosilyticus]
MSVRVALGCAIGLGLGVCARVLGYGLFGALLCVPLVHAQGGESHQSLAAALAVQKRAYKPSPNAGAEVLLRKSHIVLDEDYLAQAVVYMSVAINDDEAARDYSQITIPYNEHFDQLTLDFARVLTQHGQLENVLADAIQIQSPSQDNFYQDRKELTFSLPNVRAGSVIEFQYTRKSMSAIMPKAYFARFWLHWWQGRAGGQSSRLDPVAVREVTLLGPQSLALTSAISHPKWVKQSSKKTAAGIQWHWVAKNLRAIPLQPYMPREDGIVPFVSVSTTPQWQAVADWALALFAPHIQLDETLKRQAQRIAQQATTRDEKIRAVYALLNQQVRYVFAHVGRGGYEPHSAPAVYKNGYGDCKDQTVLTIALLRELGVEAYPALVATRSMGLPDMPVPSVYFDHMITHIPAQHGQRAIWLDTSGDQQLYPGGGIGLEGQPALIVKKNSNALTTIPDRAIDFHQAHLNVVFEPPNAEAKIDEPLKGHFSLSLSGIYEQSLRATWMYQTEKEKAITDSLANLFANAELTELTVENAEDLWLPFKVSGVWRFKAPWERDAPESIVFNVNQLLGVFAGVYQWHKPSERVQPFQLDPGFVLNASVLFKKQGQSYQELISTGPNIETPWFSVVQSSQAKPEGIAVETQIRLPSLTLARSDYAAFYDAITGLAEEQGFAVAYNLNNELGAKSNMMANATGIAGMFAGIRQDLANGQFPAALSAAKKAAALEPKNGEAQYLLGLAQGYNELLEEAAKSFELAKQLGYSQP